MNRRDEILQHTDQLISLYGFNGFSYADLSDALRITKASVHHYFPTKEDLGIAYCEGKLQHWMNFRTQVMAYDGAPTKLKAYLNLFKVCNDGKMCGIFAMQTDTARMTEPLIRAIRKVSEAELEVLTEILSEGRGRKEFRFSMTAAEQAMVISCAVKGAVLLSHLRKDNSYERVADALFKTVEGQ